MTNSQGQAVWQWAYSAFGDEEPTTAKNRFANLSITPNPGTTGISDVAYNIGFMGMYRDQESGLAQNWNRHFDRRLGRYTQPDRIGLDGGPNRYPYANSNPLLFVDPYGLQDQTSLTQTGLLLGLGGAVAKQYGGLTALGAATSVLRDSQAGFAITGVGSRTFAQAAATGAATWAINGVLIKGSFDAGALTGSALRAGVNRLASGGCGCGK